MHLFVLCSFYLFTFSSGKEEGKERVTNSSVILLSYLYDILKYIVVKNDDDNDDDF